MSSLYLSVDDDISAVATAKGNAALAVVRLSGPSSIEKLSKIFSKPKKLLKLKGYTACFGQIFSITKEVADDVVVLVYKTPKSYTGQDCAEIMCHGGSVCINEIMLSLDNAGFRRALPGEFTFRSFYNGKTDLASAEAVPDIVDAKTRIAKNDAYKRLSGVLSDEINAIYKNLRHFAAACSLRLDYGEDETPSDIATELPAINDVIKKCKELIESYSTTHIYKNGVQIALVGKTNAGKSSLFNKLLKEERAIVSASPGTTRDYIEAELDVDGIPVRLIDTAGIRSSNDPIEIEGLRRSMLLAENADFVLFVTDSTCSDIEENIFEGDKKVIPIWNKIDDKKSKKAPKWLPLGAICEWIPVSAFDGRGLEQISLILNKELKINNSTNETATIGSERQKNAIIKVAKCLENAVELIESTGEVDMVSVEIYEALQNIGLLTGETTSEDVLDELFSTFCVGK